MARSAALGPISAEYLHPLLVTKRISAKGSLELTYSDVTTLNDLPRKGNWRRYNAVPKWSENSCGHDHYYLRKMG
ncbi:hypothetical protein GGE12_006733 [Rhizobium mongolense]|uniref:Uncharacterized protein n=1 Tax=Rhizobium mongolense TaxID=57676 RepID=A0A7W6RUL3_9HYPH|nr:hypothetical protein [Rhizobium mongolense]